MDNDNNIYQAPSSELPLEVTPVNTDAAHKDVKQAAIAAFVVAGFTAALVALGVVSGAGADFGALSNPYNLVDAAIVVACGFGILRYSRAAALILFFFFIVARIAMSLDRPAGIWLSLVLLYFFWKGVRGSFNYHKLHREADPDYRAAPMWSYFLGIPALVLLTAVLSIGLMSVAGFVPSTEVVEGNALSRHDAELLVSEGIVSPEETVEYFYSTGFTSIRDEGNLLTDERIVSYERFEGELLIYSATPEEVTDVIILEKGDFLNDTVVEIHTEDGDWFILYLSAENGGDQRFIDAINARLH